MSDGLREYGPGKFSLEIDAAVYDASLEGGADEEIGDVETTGWYGILRGAIDPPADATPEEKAFLAAQAGAIISEDSQGFVSVEYYESETELEDAWSDIQDEIGELMDEEDEY